MNLQLANPDHVVAGAILPFKPDDVPPGWLVWNGQWITRAQHPRLFEAMEAVGSYVFAFFDCYGGVRIDEDTWKLPDLTTDQAYSLTGFPRMPFDIVIAQKAS